MSTRSWIVDERIGEYAAAHSTPPDALVADLRAATREVAGRWSMMQIGDDQSVLMELLAHAIGARRAIEIGTFTGTSALAVARGMGPDGHLLCLDVSEEWTAVAREHWDKAGVGDRIELRIGPAAETIGALPAEPHLDLTFIDADKTGYLGYWEAIVPRTRPGGLILVDNVLRHGQIIDPDPADEGTVAMVEFNRRVLADDRVESMILPIADGITLARRL